MADFAGRVSGIWGRWCARVAVLAAPLLLCGCLISAPGVYFFGDDFAAPKELSGNWRSIPEDGTNKSAEPVYLRFTTIANGLFRAQPLLKDGRMDINNDPEDFGLVDLGDGKYLAVSTEDEGDSIRSEFMGLSIAGDRLTFAIFSGYTPGTEPALEQALAVSGLTRDSSASDEIRLGRETTKDKLKQLFTTLMQDPERYGADLSVLTKEGMSQKAPPVVKATGAPRKAHKRRRR